MNKHLRLKRYLIWTLVFVSFAAMVSGCGKTTPSQTTNTDPQTGGTVTVGIQQEPGTFDPFLAQAAGDKEILFNIYEGLYKSDAAGMMQPALALSHTVSPDAMAYTFKLRQGVKFHNGKTLTSEDVVYSYEQATREGSNVAGLAGIASVTAPDAQTVVITLTAPDVELLPFLNNAIVPQGAEKLQEMPVGTGPFRFESYSTGQQVVLVKNDAYWIAGKPIVDRVEFLIASNADAAFLELKAGNIDIFPYLSFERASEIADRYETREDIKNMVQLLALNNERPPFDDVRVRKAMNLAVDRQGLLDQTNEGYGTELASGMSPAMGRFYNADLEGMFDQNIAEAKSLLAAAGFADGFETTITVPSNYGYHVNSAVVLAEQLKSVGIRANIEQVDWQTWLERVYFGRDYATTVIALTSEFTPKDVLSRYVSGSSGNFINFSSTAYDRIFDEIQPMIEEEARIAGYKSLQQILANEAASVYLQDPATMVAVSKSIGGYETYLIYAQDLSTVYRVD